MGIETALLVTALAASAVGGYKSYEAQKDAEKEMKKQAARERSKAPESATEQKKVDTAAKTRSAMQSNMLAGARRGSIATGGTTLG